MTAALRRIGRAAKNALACVAAALWVISAGIFLLKAIRAGAAIMARIMN